MRQHKTLLMTCIVVIASTAGFFLRREALATVFDPYSGLVSPRAPINIALMVLSLITLLFLLIFSKTTVPRNSIKSYKDGFAGGVVLRCVLGVLGISVAGFAVFEALIVGFSVLGIRNVIFVVGGVLAGLCLLYTALRGTQGGASAATSVAPVLWLCFWLVSAYIDEAMNPVILSYLYFFFALIFLVLGLYYLSGFAFGLGNAKKFLFFAPTAVYFTGVTMADTHSLPRQGMLLSLAVLLLIYQNILGRNLANDKRGDS